MKYLKALMNTTDNDTLKSQIKERIFLDEANIKQFFRNEHKECYYTTNPKNDEHICFLEGEKAVKYGKKLGCRFDVEKYWGNDDIRSMKSRVYVNPFSLEEYDDNLIYEFDSKNVPTARLYFNAEGQLLYYYSRENSPVNYESICDMFDPRRFENAYIDIPNPFDIRDKVKVTEADEVGIVVTSAKEWEEYNKMLQERNSTVFMDAAVAVECDLKNGEKVIRNISPIFLEKIEE